MFANCVLTNRRRWSAAGLALLLAAALCSGKLPRAAAQSPYATQLIAQNGAYGGVSLYADPNAVLGPPTRMASNNDPAVGISPFRIKIVEAAYNVDLEGNKVVTRLSRRSVAGGFDYGSITVRFDQSVYDDPANPYGIDLNVFGNAFYAGSGFPSDVTDMNSFYLTGGMFAEPVVVSVSPDNVNWYTYATGPYADTAFPTQAYEWNAGWTSIETDFTKPVNPTLGAVLGAPGQQMSAADAMTTYVGSGGGTGFDLAESGFDWIQYVRVEATAQFRDGEIDAFADVRPIRVGETLSITPDNVTAGTPLYFQSTVDESHTALIAEFTVVSGMAKLMTGAVTDAGALAALPDGAPLATYELNIEPLLGALPIDFAANLQLSPGDNYSGDGSDLELLQWDGGAWQPTVFSFDAASGRVLLSDWSDAAAMFVITQLSAPPLDGDFNRDGRVDAADYITWRRGQGATYNETHYDQWRANFGAASGNSGGGSAVTDAAATPEPGAYALAGIALLIGLLRRRLVPSLDGMG